MKNVMEHVLNILLHPWGNGEIIMGCLSIADVKRANINLLVQSECAANSEGEYQVQGREWVSDKMMFGNFGGIFVYLLFQVWDDEHLN